MLLWLDLETSGLDPHRHIILEVACILTNDDLSEVASYDAVINPGVSDVLRLLALTSDDFVIDMHTKNGLVEEINLGATTSMAEAEKHILEMVEDIPKKELILAGNSVHFDRKFIDEYMPALAKKLNYRIFDVRTLMQMEEFWAPGATEETESVSVHRAMPDIEFSLRTAHKYKSLLEKVTALSE